MQNYDETYTKIAKLLDSDQTPQTKQPYIRLDKDISSLSLYFYILISVMLRSIVSLFTILGLGLSLQAQSLADKIVPHAGFTWEFVTDASDPDPGLTFLSNYYTFGGGAYYVLAHRNDIVSVGVDPNINLGLNFRSTLDNRVVFNYIVQVPVYVMGRLGANATPYNTQNVGIGLGIGARYTYLSEIITPAADQRQLISVINPSAVAEFTYRNTIFRAHFALAQPEVNTTIRQVFTGQEVILPLRVGNFGLGIISSF